MRSRAALAVFALAGLATPALAGCRGLRGGAGDAGADASAEAGPADAAADAAPADDTIPPTASDELTVRAKHLLEAIAQDNIDLASDIVFPRDAWMTTRDATDPGKEWEKRVARPIRRAMHALARRHKDLDRAQFASLELGRTMRQATLKKHGWTKPLWIVTGSHLTFVVDGHTRTLLIHEMTAWRGAWYVTRL
ncbi:MAG TPA: hypothetical protein VHV30_02740 [Polyangiaceae bacterium]|nr:hypothetical protein [Polyangiaceae bacterium]